MPFGDIIVDICQEADPAKLTQLVAASKKYWTSDQKGYKLISDDKGKDFIRSYESKISSGRYEQGSTKYLASGQVILIYQR